MFLCGPRPRASKREVLLWPLLHCLLFLLKLLQKQTQLHPILQQKTLSKTPQTLLGKTLKYSYASYLGNS